MAFLTIADAREARGVRLVTTRGVPVPWGEAAKAFLHVKQIPYLRAGQDPGGENAELVAWTGVRTAPVLVIDDEPPIDRWMEILLRLEAIQPEPRLIPEGEGQRALMFGLANELLGPDGYVPNKRIWLNAQAASVNATLSPQAIERLRSHGEGNIARAPQRIARILRHFGEVLRAQAAVGSPYFLGDSLTALDIYWAACTALIRPLDDELCPLEAGMRYNYTENVPEVLAAIHPILLEHRDYIYRTYLETPVEL